MSVDYDIWDFEDPQKELTNFAAKWNYDIPKKISDTLFEIKLCDQDWLFVSKYGVLVFLKRFDRDFGETASDIIEWKETISKEYIENRNTEPHILLDKYHNFFAQKLDCVWIFQPKVHYTLICYAPESENFNDKGKQKHYLWLMFKRKPNDEEICDEIADTMKAFGASSVKKDENNVFYSIWGARIVFSKNNKELMQSYIRSEVSNQSLWLLISQMNKYMDKFISESKSRSKQLFEIIDRVYDVMFYQAEFKYVNSKTTHRYQLEIQQKLYEVSNIDTMSNYFIEKMEILEKKVKMLSEKEERKSSERLNLILNILTIVSSISAIFQIVDYWINAPQNRSGSIVASVIVLITLTAILAVKFFLQKMRMTILQRKC